LSLLARSAFLLLVRVLLALLREPAPLQQLLLLLLYHQPLASLLLLLLAVPQALPCLLKAAVHAAASGCTG
jgi:hypothetical protein